MIARIWRGHVEERDAAEYLALMRSVALPDYRRTPGNLAAYALHRPGPSMSEFTMLTFWDSDDAIRAFAGDDITRAKYYGFDRSFLVSLPPHAEHLQAYDR